jgi:transcriptional regulator with XRE-family HTH domain
MVHPLREADCMNVGRASLEQGRANPTWSTVQQLANALGFDAEIRLVPKRDDIRELAERIRTESPGDRLFSQPVVVHDALVRLVSHEIEFVVDALR